MGMLAHVDFDPQTDEQRRTPRRTLRLDVEGGGAATIRNLSHQGLLIETTDGLEVGDRVSLELPIAGEAQAQVIWARAPFYGCEFARPISRAAISAALLLAPIEEPPVTLLGPIDTTWQVSDGSSLNEAPRSTNGALLALFGLACVIAGLVMSLASLQAV